ncbi:FeoC-like transcriptional regulator [Orrella daihaiensis]|uniref:FeoC-like transcriptional regulator n=1 Tax=Orrella daihaiensis TaxID=2782176 RepID=A0ABY4AK83_9BURK|nr:FeoC-like transcriptional regulator [Orrella daihaiensis]UOD49477.1 FeoC-like transcriptional regulator [Orrella daihaiensis]
MILSKVTNYLKLNRRAALLDMACVLDISPEALRHMLDRLEIRGTIRRLPTGTTCGGGCNKCKPQDIELYEWCC